MPHLLEKQVRLILFSIIINVCLLSILTNSCMAQAVGKKNSFVFAGKLAGRDSGIVTLCYTDISGKYHVDTTYLDHGNFRFLGQISEPTLAYLIGKLSSRSMDDPNRLVFFLEQGKISGTFRDGDLVNSEITGSLTQNEYSVLKVQQKKVNKKMDSLRTLISGRDKQQDSNKYEDEYSVLLNQFRSLEFDFIKSHPNSVASTYLLDNYFGKVDYNFESLKIIYNGFTENVKNSRLGKVTAKSILNYESAQQGNLAPVFSAVDVKGINLGLKDYVNKSIILLDFWASWCAPCHLQAPYFRKLYEKYKSSGFEIISISADIDRDLWEKAITADSISLWKNIILADVEKFDSYGSLATRYGVSAYPTILLIDQTGRIVYRKSGFDEGTDPSRWERILSGLISK